MAQQHRVLLLGIVGALVMRASLILVGAALLEAFHWMIYVFGCFLVVTGIKMYLQGDEKIEPEKNPVVRLFERRWDDIARVARPELERLPVAQRATRLAELLTSLGYMAEVRPGGRDALPVLTEHNCAIRVIAERFPEVCAAEERFIADLLGAPVTRQAHIAKGANCCEYCVGTRDS